MSPHGANVSPHALPHPLRVQCPGHLRVVVRSQEVSARGQFPLHHEGPRVFPFHILTPTHTSLPLLSTVGSFFMADAQSVSMARVQIWSGPPGSPSLQERHKYRRDIRVQARASPVVHRCCLTMCARSEHPRVEGETCDTLDRATAFQKAAEHGPCCGARFLLHGSAGCSR